MSDSTVGSKLRITARAVLGVVAILIAASLLNLGAHIGAALFLLALLVGSVLLGAFTLVALEMTIERLRKARP